MSLMLRDFLSRTVNFLARVKLMKPIMLNKDRLACESWGWVSEVSFVLHIIKMIKQRSMSYEMFLCIDAWKVKVCGILGLQRSISSFWTKYDSTHISVILFLRAGLSSFLPKSPEGFMVATMLNPSYPMILIASVELFSDKISILSDSKTELSLSRTESLANDISSMSSKPPVYMASTNIPSCHSKTILSSILSLLTFLYNSLRSSD